MGGGHINADADAYELTVIMEEHRLKRILPKGTITWRKGISESTIDLIFVPPLLRDSLIDTSLITDDVDHHSDHYPIRISFDLKPRAAETRVKRS